MRIATWNVNSIKARLPTVMDVLKDIECDVVALQELKCETDAFPYLELEDAGWTCAVHGQKSYNGVALLSKFPLDDIQTGLPGDDSDEQARFIDALVMCERPVRVASLYLPNGNPAPGPKYDYKLGWMDRLIAHAEAQLAAGEHFILSGDYNCIPRDEDCWDISVWAEDGLARLPTRERFRQLQWLGLTEAFETLDARAHQYSFWDYQGGALAKDHGIRIDHHLCAPQVADRLEGVEIYRKAREMTKPSDHVPVIIEIAD